MLKRPSSLCGHTRYSSSDMFGKKKSQELLDYRVVNEVAEMLTLMGNKNATEAEREMIEEIKSQVTMYTNTCISTCIHMYIFSCSRTLRARVFTCYLHITILLTYYYILRTYYYITRSMRWRKRSLIRSRTSTFLEQLGPWPRSGILFYVLLSASCIWVMSRVSCLLYMSHVSCFVSPVYESNLLYVSHVSYCMPSLSKEKLF